MTKERGPSPGPKGFDLRDASSAMLVSQYRAAASERGRALLNVDPQRANRAFDAAQLYAEELARRGELLALRALLVDDDPGVLLAAASKLLQVAPDEAHAVLTELGQERNLIGLSAAATLEASRHS